jgi:hypothetical protein
LRRLSFEPPYDHPFRQGTDNYQALEYQPPQRQGRIATIGSCAACHRGSHGASEGGGLGDFAETHGGHVGQNVSSPLGGQAFQIKEP